MSAATDFAIPLTAWADRRLAELAALTGSPRIAALNAATLLGERAAAGGFVVPGCISAGRGGSRLMAAQGGWIALTITRPDDRTLLPALFQDSTLDPGDDTAIIAAVAVRDCTTLVARGRELGMAIASVDEAPPPRLPVLLTRGPRRTSPATVAPLVVDLSAIWAGPLAGHLLWQAGARVIKVESRTRPDAMRDGDPALFASINQGKASVVIDFGEAAERSALIALIRRADIVIEAARPRGLRQLGIDADALTGECPGLVWLTITAHGARRDAANWIGVGHDCGVAAGLSRALADATGEIGFVGDAVPDPLTGIMAALVGWRAFQSGTAQRIDLSLSGVAALALADARAHDAGRLKASLQAWHAARGRPFPAIQPRAITAEVSPRGRDTAQWLHIHPC